MGRGVTISSRHDWQVHDWRLNPDCLLEMYHELDYCPPPVCHQARRPQDLCGQARHDVAGGVLLVFFTFGSILFNPGFTMADHV